MFNKKQLSSIEIRYGSMMTRLENVEKELAELKIKHDCDTTNIIKMISQTLINKPFQSQMPNQKRPTFASVAEEERKNVISCKESDIPKILGGLGKGGKNE